MRGAGSGVRSTLMAIVTLVLAPAASADVAVALPFGEGMVLQRGEVYSVWGTAAPGERITVRFQETAAEGTATADGTWRIQMARPRVGGPYEMQITGANTLRIGNVLVGDVWLCAGQSNMAMKLRAVDGGTDAMREAKNPSIRLLHFEGAATDAGWSEADAESAGGFSAICYLFGRRIQQHTAVPTGLIDVSVGGSLAESWIPEEAFVASAGLRELRRNAAARHRRRDGATAPSAAFESRIRPLRGFGVKGVVWYQGEANANEGGDGYDLLLEALIRNWREAWGNAALPFLYVQLPGLRGPESAAGGWPRVRAAQAAVAHRVPGTVMICTADLTDDRLHSRVKVPIAERLALAARAIVFGEQIGYSAPRLTAAARRGAEVVMRWDPPEEALLARGEDVRGFELADQYGAWHSAAAVLAKGSVRIFSPGVKRPTAVRYGWSQELGTNLFSARGLPVEPLVAQQVTESTP